MCSINKNPNGTVSIMLCTGGATFVKKSSCFVVGIVSFDTVGLHLLTFCILEPYASKYIALVSITLSHINGIIIVPIKSYLNQCF